MQDHRPQPNILIILSDQHHPRMLGHAGDPVLRTPNLDALAAQGTRFTNAYCGGPLCVPSRMTFLTSRHGSNIEVWSNTCLLASDIPTFAHTLGAAGYETVLCGRMHFEGPDQHHGFERRILGDFTRNRPGLSGVSLAGLPAGTGQHRKVVEHAGPGRTTIHAYDEAVTEAACRFLAERKPGERPWCMVVGYYLPHSPFICPKDLFEEYYARVPLPVPDTAERHPAIRAWCEKRDLLTPVPEAHVRAARAAYYGMVTLLDRNIGRVLSGLDASAQRENTLRLYLSDHGEMAGEHGMWWKSNFYEGSVSVPMIWSWPGAMPQGAVRNQLVSLLDVGPTLEALAGCTAPHAVDGQSLLPLLAEEGGRADWPNAVFAELTDARMIRSGPWKLVAHHGYAEPQLFNLDTDPAELDDRARDPACRRIRETLLARVGQGWDPAQNAATVSRRKADGALLVAWANAVNPPQDYVWPAPPGTNRFPEP